MRIRCLDGCDGTYFHASNCPQVVAGYAESLADALALLRRVAGCESRYVNGDIYMVDIPRDLFDAIQEACKR